MMIEIVAGLILAVIALLILAVMFEVLAPFIAVALAIGVVYWIVQTIRATTWDDVSTILLGLTFYAAWIGTAIALLRWKDRRRVRRRAQA